jgi:hypothetical protein
MTLSRQDILTLSAPRTDDVIESVRYAVKSIPHTYDRMEKVAWKRAARIARGKVNESLLLPALREMGLQPAVKEKSYRDIDFNDFVLKTTDAPVDVDLKTFHILNWFVKEPRKPISPARLVSSSDHTGPWHDFYPMLVPYDYQKVKDLLVFAVSVEYGTASGVAPVQNFPWLAFPETPGEQFLINPDEIKRRESLNAPLSVQITWPSGMRGRADVVFEREGDAHQRPVNLPDAGVSVEKISSLICVGLDDAARRSLGRSGGAIGMKVYDQASGRQVLSTAFKVERFKEIFPRGRYDLHVVGWIGLDEFMSRAVTIPRGTPCYFYPPRVRPGERHEPSTKTRNRYVLPQSLNPISTLTETFS